MIHQFDARPGRTALLNGKEYLFFSGYSYLGMHQVQQFNDLIKEGVDKYGLLFASSRVSNTRLKLYEEFEGLLSTLTGSEDTVSLSSGYLAGQLAIGVLGPVQNAPHSHPAITENIGTESGFENPKATKNPKNPPATIVSDSVYAGDAVNVLTASLNDFSFLNGIKHPATTIIDDSHGIGIIGENGRGVTSILPRNSNLEYIFTYSLSKAFGLGGGAISCSKKQADLLRTAPIYTSSTAMSPAAMFAFIHGQDLYQQQREQLKNNLIFFQNLVGRNPRIQFHPELPVFILPTSTDENYLFQKEILISSFAYPDPFGKKIKRIVLNACHTEADMEYLFSVLNNIPSLK